MPNLDGFTTVAPYYDAPACRKSIGKPEIESSPVFIVQKQVAKLQISRITRDMLGRKRRRPRMNALSRDLTPL